MQSKDDNLDRKQQSVEAKEENLKKKEEKLQELTAGKDGVEVRALPSLYPQGGENSFEIALEAETDCEFFIFDKKDKTLYNLCIAMRKRSTL